jgi:phosphatidylinositol alpha-mannosyltransferase
VKVSIVNPTHFSIDEGGSNTVFQLAHFLTEAGLNIVLFTFTRAFDAFSSLLSEGVITLEGVTIKKYQPRPLRIIGMRPQDYSRQMIDDISQERSDLVHIHSFSQLPLLISLLRKVKIPIVLSPTQIHEVLQDVSSSLHRNLLKKAIRHCGKKVSLFIVDTPEDKKALVSAGIEERKIAYVHHTIDYQKMAALKRKEEDVILTVGRYAPNKGLHNLISAARLLLGTYPGAKFYVVGSVFDKEYHKLLEDKIRGIEGKIYLTGSLEEAKLLNLFSRAKLFVFPSITDTHGLVTIEAMAAGIPVIASQVEGTAPIIQDGVNGLLIPPNDVPALVDKISDLWENSDKRALLAKKGREAAKRYYWGLNARTMIKLYSGVIEKESASKFMEEDPGING